MLGRLKSFFQTRANAPADARVSETVIVPDEPFVAIGDVHGCLAELQDLMSRVEAAGFGEYQKVFLGDYVDRGPNSAEVLAELFAMQMSSPDRVTCLMGNHERMLLDFVDDPAGAGTLWLQNGGLQSLESFGISGLAVRPEAEDAMDAADALEGAMPSGLQKWLRECPLRWSSGNVHCVHAAMSPRRKPSDQSGKTMLWGHPKFLTEPRDDGLTVVHGHTIVSEPTLSGTRLSIDTGAYRTGILTAAVVQPNRGISYVSTAKKSK